MSKVVDLPSAMSLVDDGSHLALSGFAITRNAVAAVHELIRSGRRHLTLSQVVGGMETDLLIGSGCVDHLNYSGGSLDRFGPLHQVNRAISDKSIVAHEYSSLSLTFRFLAGSLGLPYLPALPMLGSQLLDQLTDTDGVKTGTDPFTGKPVVLLAALRPDVAIVHADVADESGNAIVAGPRWSLRETVLAADRVIVTCERVVETGSLDPDRVTIPGNVVAAVAVARLGAHPTAVYGQYDYDREHLMAYTSATGAGGSALVSYMDRFIISSSDHSGYLSAAGRPV